MSEGDEGWMGLRVIYKTVNNMFQWLIRYGRRAWG